MNFRIAIPKGTLVDEAIELLEKLNIKFEKKARKLLFSTNHNDIEILIVRPSDVAIYVERGGADLGMVGSDILEEYSPNIIRLRDLGFGACRLALATPVNSNISDPNNIPPYSIIASKFANCTDRFFQKLGINVEIINLHGSMEIAPITGISDYIVDLVGTGTTLKENGLKEIYTISHHTTQLIANKQSWQIKSKKINEILINIDSIV